MLGAFGPEDRILVVMESGAYELVKPELSVHFPDDMMHLDKWHSDRALTAVHRDGEKKAVYVKRFNAESSSKMVSFIGEEEGSALLLFTDHGAPVIKCKAKDLGEQRFSLAEFIAVKGVKARGKRLSLDPRAKVVLEDTPDPNLEAKAEAVAADVADTESAAQASKVSPDQAGKAAAEPVNSADKSDKGEKAQALRQEKSTGTPSEGDGGEVQSSLF